MAVKTQGRETQHLDRLRKQGPWMLITQLYWMSYKLLERRFYHLSVSASQARVIEMLYYYGPIKPSLVATLLFQETQSITGILHRIEARGWVTREPDVNDRRAVSLTLTAKGLALAEQIVAIADGLYDELFASQLTATEKKGLESTLRKLRERGFGLPETDFKLRRARGHVMWSF